MTRFLICFLSFILLSVFTTRLYAQTDTAAVDSGKLLLNSTNNKALQLKAGIDLLRNKRLNGSVTVVSTVTDKNNQVKDKISKSLQSLKKNDIKLSLTLENDNRYQPLQFAGLNTANQKFVSAFNIIGGITAWGVPLNFSYSTNRNLAYTPLSAANNLFKFDFDPQQYANMFRSDVQRYYQLRKTTFLGSDLTKYTQKKALEVVGDKAGNLKTDVAGARLLKYVTDEVNMNRLLVLNEPALRDRLMEVAMAQDSELAEVSEKAGKATNDPNYASQLKVIQPDSVNTSAVAGKVDSLTAMISSIKNELEQNGYEVKKILQMQKLINNDNGDMGASEMARNYMTRKPANSAENVFSQVESLKLGAFGNQVPGNLQSRDVFMNGGHLTFRAGSTPFTVGYGSVNDIRSFKDAGFQSSVYNTPKTLTYIGAEVKRGSFRNLKVSMISGLNQNSNSNLYAIPTISANTVAFTLSQGLKMGRVGSFTFDVSKSTTLYANKYSIGSEVILDRKGGLAYDAGNDLFEALSFGLSHHLDVKDIGLTDNVYFNYAGMGYQNPANNGYGGARKRLGGNVKKTFYKNKLSFNLRSDLKEMPISYSSNDKWRALQLQLDTRYVISKKLNVNLKYITNGTGKRVDDVFSSVYSFKKLQFDGNANYKLGKHYSVSHFGIGTQMYSNMNATALPASNMLLINYSQSVVFKTNTLSATVLYNKEMSSYKLIGDMLNSDVSYQYNLFKKVNLSSGITYLENGKLAQQVGLRQSIQLFTKNNFDVDSYIDVRKNLIRPQYADLYASCRAELVLRYHLNN